MKIPGYDALRVFEAAHFTPHELYKFTRACMQLPRSSGISPDDSSLTPGDYGQETA